MSLNVTRLKKVFFAITIMIPLFSSADNNINSEEKFNQIKNEVVSEARQVISFRANDAFSKIKNTLNDFRELRKTVKEAKSIDSVIDEVTNSLDEIATTYEEVAEMSTPIKTFRNEKINVLISNKNNTASTLTDISNKKGLVESENADFRKKLSDTSLSLTETEKQKLDISIKGNNSIIKSLEAEEKIWGKFNQAQDSLLLRLNMNGEKVDLLLHALKTNASVYREAANVARLRKSAKDALNGLNSLSDIKDIIGDLQNSWLEVDDIVGEISNAELNVSM